MNARLALVAATVALLCTWTLQAATGGSQEPERHAPGSLDIIREDATP